MRQLRFDVRHFFSSDILVKDSRPHYTYTRYLSQPLDDGALSCVEEIEREA